MFGFLAKKAKAAALHSGQMKSLDNIPEDARHMARLHRFLQSDIASLEAKRRDISKWQKIMSLISLLVGVFMITGVLTGRISLGCSGFMSFKIENFFQPAVFVGVGSVIALQGIGYYTFTKGRREWLQAVIERFSEVNADEISLIDADEAQQLLSEKLNIKFGQTSLFSGSQVLGHSGLMGSLDLLGGMRREVDIKWALRLNDDEEHIDMVLAEIFELRKKRRRVNGRTTTTTQRVLVFRGVITFKAAERHVEDAVLTYSEMESSGVLRFLRRDGMQSTTLDNPEFEEYYEVETTNQIEARRQLTPEHMYLLTGFALENGCIPTTLVDDGVVITLISLPEKYVEWKASMPLNNDFSLRTFFWPLEVTQRFRQLRIF